MSGEEIIQTNQEVVTPQPLVTEEIPLPIEPAITEQPPVEEPPTELPAEDVETPPATEPDDGTPKPSIEELQTKLKEYEVNKDEELKIRQRLGISDEVDDKTYSLLAVDSQIINQGKQTYLQLCNEYGVDATPEKIATSLDELKKKDPAKGFEFERKIELLNNEVSSKRSYVAEQQYNYDVNKFVTTNKPLLEASPAIGNLVNEYVTNNYGSQNIYTELNNIMDIVGPLYQEAIEVGKQIALTKQAKTDTTAVSGGIATATTPNYPGNTTFTREQISKMSLDEFSKYEKLISKQMQEGKIQ